MPTQVTNYQCPSCTGPLHYSGASGKLECDYCGSSYSVAEIEALYKEKEAKAAEAFETADTAAQSGDDSSAWDTASMSSDWGADAAGMKTYSVLPAVRSSSAMRTPPRPPARTAATRPSCRGSLPGR